MKTQSSPSEIRLLRSRKLDPLSLPSVHTQLFSWRENKDGDGVNSGCERIELRSHGLLVRKAFMAGRSLLSSCFSIHCLESVSAQGHSARPSFSQCRRISCKEFVWPPMPPSFKEDTSDSSLKDTHLVPFTELSGR
ncbi:hypothetical protein IC582_020029 [Cucumis melo]|uniref:Uncharacterized protein LOC103502888 n=1 Tax=Cucumis melo TaxID=3656 RepID=A0ABM3L2F6_CUCME|nr:uncharacterized protein LOC103502888 [Cucumis melo]